MQGKQQRGPDEPAVAEEGAMAEGEVDLHEVAEQQRGDDHAQAQQVLENCFADSVVLMFL